MEGKESLDFIEGDQICIDLTTNEITLLKKF